MNLTLIVLTFKTVLFGSISLPFMCYMPLCTITSPCVCMYVYACVCVCVCALCMCVRACVPDIGAINNLTSEAMCHDMDPIELVKQVLQLLYGTCSRYHCSLSNDVCRTYLPMYHCVANTKQTFKMATSVMKVGVAYLCMCICIEAVKRKSVLGNR